MKYLLDTDHASILQRPAAVEYATLVANLNLHSADGTGVSVVSFHEQMLGANARINQARTSAEFLQGYDLMFKVVDLYRQFPLVAFGAAAATVFAGLKRQRIRVGTMDLRIASTALAHGMTVVTRNARDFGKVPGLRIEDWTK